MGQRIGGKHLLSVFDDASGGSDRYFVRRNIVDDSRARANQNPSPNGPFGDNNGSGAEKGFLPNFADGIQMTGRAQEHPFPQNIINADTAGNFQEAEPADAGPRLNIAERADDRTHANAGGWRDKAFRVDNRDCFVSGGENLLKNLGTKKGVTKRDGVGDPVSQRTVPGKGKTAQHWEAIHLCIAFFRIIQKSQ